MRDLACIRREYETAILSRSQRNRGRGWVPRVPSRGERHPPPSSPEDRASAFPLSAVTVRAARKRARRSPRLCPAHRPLGRCRPGPPLPAPGRAFASLGWAGNGDDATRRTRQHERRRQLSLPSYLRPRLSATEKKPQGGPGGGSVTSGRAQAASGAQALKDPGSVRPTSPGRHRSPGSLCERCARAQKRDCDALHYAGAVGA